MAKRKQSATTQMRSKIARQIRSMEKRGYRFSSEFKESLKTAKYQTLKSLYGTEKRKYRKLYERATAEVDGEVVSGRRKQKEVRKEAQRKGVETRKRKEAQKQPVYASKELAKIERTLDKKMRGEVIYNRVVEMIDSIPFSDKPYFAGGKLRQVLNLEIAFYGDSALQAIADADEEILAEAEVALKYSFDENNEAFRRAFENIQNLIRSTVPTAEDMQRIQDLAYENQNMDDLPI